MLAWGICVFGFTPDGSLQGVGSTGAPLKTGCGLCFTAATAASMDEKFKMT